MRTYKLYGAVSSTANNVANIQFVRNGRIRGLRWAVGFDAPADNASAAVELSLQPVSQLGTNNTQGVIDEVRFLTNLTTSGAPPGSHNFQRTLDMPIASGEVAYFNALVSGTVSANVTVFIDVDEKG